MCKKTRERERQGMGGGVRERQKEKEKERGLNGERARVREGQNDGVPRSGPH